MKINPSNFAAVQSTDSVIEETVKQINEVDTYPVVAFPFFSAKNASSATPVFDVFDVPVGTRITMRIDFQRNGGKSVLGNQCDRKNYILEKTFTASRDYGNMAEWFNGDNISTTLNSGIEDAAGTETINNDYLTPTNSVAASPLGTTTGYSANKSATEIANANLFGTTATDPTTNFYYRIYEDTSNQDPNGNNLIYLLINGPKSCGNTSNKRSELEVSFSVYRSDSTYVFETEPEDALPDVWYENNESFNISNGLHQGNVQSQTKDSSGLIIQSAKINTGFIN